jgi:NHS family xanthosine MFS transporter
MSIKFRLIVMNFLEFFVWGSWLISLGAYMFNVSCFRCAGCQVYMVRWELLRCLCQHTWGIVADRWST